MNEVVEVKKIANPVETLLLADAMIGQDSCTVAREFNEKVGITGIVLTRIDGSARARRGAVDEDGCRRADKVFGHRRKDRRV